MMQPLRFISICAGIGGFDLGFEAAGMRCVAQIEIDDYATHILEKHWPDVPRFRDLRRTCARMLPDCDVLAGGIPCQPHSLAGKRGAGSDTRDLWPDFFRLICEIRPAYAVVENVPGLRSSDNGRFFGRILSDLAALGYAAEWVSLSAADVGAPHQRERVWIVAYSEGKRLIPQRLPIRTKQKHAIVDERSSAVSNPDSQRWRGRQQQQKPVAQRKSSAIAVSHGDAEHMANADSARCTKQHVAAESNITRYDSGRVDFGGDQGPTQSQLGRTFDGLSVRMDNAWGDDWERDVPRTASGISHRNARLKCLGNAIVPQCAAIIGNAIVQHWSYNNDFSTPPA